MIIPATAKDIIEIIKSKYFYSTKEIAQAIGVSAKTLYSVQNNKVISPDTAFNIMLFYLQINIVTELKNEKKFGAKNFQQEKIEEI